MSLPFTVGNTPIVRLNKIAPHLFGKAEYLNPTGSIKDRAGAGMLIAAIKDGKLREGTEILDSSSGNTGISLAAFGASLGLRVNIVLPKSASIERQRLLKLFGANIIYSDAMEGSDGAIFIARELAEKNPSKYLYVDQYSNEANWLSHYEGTGVEIWQQTGGKVTHFVAGVGTGGTIMGTGKKLKEQNPEIRIIAVEPDGPLHGLEGLKHIESSIKPKIFDPNFPDETAFIETEKSQAMVKRIAREEGVFVGTSSGATVLAALEYAKEAGNTVVAILADQGSRYLSERYLSD